MQSKSERNKKSREYRKRNLQRRRNIEQQSKLKLKIEVITYYGGVCKCCGESGIDFLSIDHIDGGGTKHRKLLPSGSGSMYRWLKKNNYPINYQVLCFNCNFSKYLGNGICLHKRIISNDN